MGCDKIHGDTAHAHPISIHAPQWGATVEGKDYEYTYAFQSTHPSGVRLPRREGHGLHHPHFNPRTPVGCDRRQKSTDCGHSYFNPRTPVGVRPSVRLPVCRIHAFQSTHPSGVRLSEFAAKATGGLFQSTHPSGVRPGDKHGAGGFGTISIHAPQWGATPIEIRYIPAAPISIHAPQWGATPARLPLRVFHRDFNPRTPVGCDRSACT